MRRRHWGFLSLHVLSGDKGVQDFFLDGIFFARLSVPFFLSLYIEAENKLILFTFCPFSLF